MLNPRHRLRPRRLDARAVADHLLDRYRRGRPATLPARADAPDVAPDVHLDIPRLHVDKVELKVDEITARLALDASVLDLVQLHVGVDAQLRGVDLDIEGVDAQALLNVHLDNLVAIVDRTMSTLDRTTPKLRDRLMLSLERKPRLPKRTDGVD